jgi:hypothetical protein
VSTTNAAKITKGIELVYLPCSLPRPETKLPTGGFYLTTS